MKKNIGILTTTRADFGLLKPLILGLMNQDFCETKVLVTGTHLLPEFGNTYKEIEDAKIPISTRIDCITKGDKAPDITNNISIAINKFGVYFNDNPLDLLIVLGDRYEVMAVCISAMIAGIPIAHIHGGEITEGAIDDAIRHSITKMSQLHFVSTDIYRKRVIQLGEQPNHVYNVGALAVENILNNTYLSKKQLEETLHFDLSEPFAIVTFHPVTLDDNNGMDEFEELIKALDNFPDMSFIITKSNADTGGRQINSRIDKYASEHDNIISVASLGVQRYLSAMKQCTMVIGNSSSGIIEAPCLHVPTVNIGDRQKGRVMSESIISCLAKKEDIINAINKASSDEFNKNIQALTNPYGTGDTSIRIINTIKTIFKNNNKIEMTKKFFDIDSYNTKGDFL